MNETQWANATQSTNATQSDQWVNVTQSMNDTQLTNDTQLYSSNCYQECTGCTSFSLSSGYEQCCALMEVQRSYVCTVPGSYYIDYSGQCDAGSYAYIYYFNVDSAANDKFTVTTYTDSTKTQKYASCTKSSTTGCLVSTSVTCGKDSQNDVVIEVTCDNAWTTCSLRRDIKVICTPYSSSTSTPTPAATSNSIASGSYKRTSISPVTCMGDTSSCNYKCSAAYKVSVSGSSMSIIPSSHPSQCTCYNLAATVSGSTAVGTAGSTSFTLSATSISTVDLVFSSTCKLTYELTSSASAVARTRTKTIVLLLVTVLGFNALFV